MIKTVGITFGRWNPPHKGHLALWEMMKENERFYIGTNEDTHDIDNPLPFNLKRDIIISLMPEIEDYFYEESTWLTLAERIYKDHGKVNLVCYTDEDWVLPLLKEYNGDGYHFKKISVKETPRLSSGTDLRKAVSDGDRDSFVEAAGFSKVTIDDKVLDYFDLVEKHMDTHIKEDIPNKYRAGLSDTTAEKRKRFWVKLGKYPFTKSEYEKAEKVPGDSKETRSSKYNRRYKEMYEEIDALRDKSDKSGVPYSILKKVYDRGMAAWVTGHRPGATQHAWAFARVNSFLTKGKTWKTADADLAKEARKYMKENTEYDKYQDNEIEMATSQLKKIADLAQDAMNYIQNQNELDAWMQDKISVSVHNMEAIYDYFHYSEEVQLTEKHFYDYPYYGWITPSGKIIMDSYKTTERKFHKSLFAHGYETGLITDEEINSVLERLEGMRGKGSKITQMSKEEKIEVFNSKADASVTTAERDGFVRFLVEEDENVTYFGTGPKPTPKIMKAIGEVMYKIVTDKKIGINSKFNIVWFNGESGEMKYSEFYVDSDFSALKLKKLPLSETVVKKNNMYWLYSKSGEKLLGGPYKSKKEVLNRERQVQYFKHKKG